MPNFILVMLGGAAGAGCRYAIGQLAARHLQSDFPWGTLTVNLLGGLLMGLLAGALAHKATLHDPIWLLFGIGLLGGFTTFSAFSLEAVMLFERGAPGSAAAYVLASVIGAIGLFAAGLLLARTPA